MANFYAIYPGSSGGSGQVFDTGAGPTTSTTLRTVIVTDQTPIPVTSTPGTLDFGPSAAAERVAALLGNPTGLASFGAGTTSAQTLRTVLVTDQSAIPAAQSGSWTVASTQSGLWDVSVNNFPTTQPVSGTVAATQSGLWDVSVNNFPSTQPVSGTVAATQSGTWTVGVSNFPATQPVSGTVAVSNFPATQPVSGTITANQGTSPWVENVSQFGGSNVVTGTGASGAGIPRVTVASDSSLTNITGTISLPTGAATETTLAAINTKTLQQSFGPATQAASISVSLASNQPAIAVTAGTTPVAYTAVGSMDFAAITNAYTTVLAITATTKTLFVFNSLDQPILVSINSGANDSFSLVQGDGLSIDLAADGMSISSGVNIQAKYTGSAPSAGSVRISALG